MSMFDSSSGGTAVLDLPPARPDLQIIPPRLQVRASSAETVAGNKYDFVLTCQPDARDNFSFYDGIIDLVERGKGLRIYSPHNDIKRGADLGEVVLFTTSEAIPRTRAVLAHLTIITPDIQKMFDSTYRNSRPFVVFYAQGMTPFNEANAKNVKSHPGFRGEVVYRDEDHALRLLEQEVERLMQFS